MSKFGVRDAGLMAIRALPVGAQTVVSSVLDVGTGTSHGDFGPSGDADFLLEAPVLNSTQLPNGESIAYDIIESANADLSSPRVIRYAAVVQTGASGNGAPAAQARYRPSTSALRYQGFQATGTAGVAASNAKATMTFILAG